MVPRLKLRQRSALDTVQPHVDEIQEALGALQYRLSAADIEKVFSSVSTLVKNVNDWAKQDIKDDASRREVCCLYR